MTDTQAEVVVVIIRTHKRNHITLYEELERQGPKGLSVLLSEIIRHTETEFDWDPEAIMDGLECALDVTSDETTGKKATCQETD